jgi:hypothetical protein
MKRSIPIQLRERGGSKPPQAKESEIQRAILDWLAAERIWHIRLNTGAMAGSHKGKKWFVRFGRPGMADILAVRMTRESCWHIADMEITSGLIDSGAYHEVPQVVWIEVKGPKGNQSDDQQAFEVEVVQAGMEYLLAHSLDDVIAVLK